MFDPIFPYSLTVLILFLGTSKKAYASEKKRRPRGKAWMKFS